MTEITQADVDAAIEWYSPRESEWQGLLAEHFARHRMEERAAIVAMIWGDVRSDYISEYHADILRDLIDRIEGGEHLK